MTSIDWEKVFKILSTAAKNGKIEAIAESPLIKEEKVSNYLLIEWLADEGFIKGISCHGRNVRSENPRLTALGFDLYCLLQNTSLWEQFTSTLAEKNLPFTLTFIKTAIPVFYRDIAENQLNKE